MEWKDKGNSIDRETLKNLFGKGGLGENQAESYIKAKIEYYK